MSIDKVRVYFKQFGMENRILEPVLSSATVELAAKALQCEPERIAKSLAFKGEEQPFLVITAGTKRIDNKKFKEQFKIKAKMLSPEETKELIGHEVGGVCPFAVNPGVRVYLDISLQPFATVFPACGSSNSAIELTVPELEKYANFTDWVDVCKPD